MRILKIFLFFVFFYFFSLGLAFLFRDDEGAYSRLVMHDLQSQENVDILFCGASHVSHGVLSEMLDTQIGKDTCSAGTPNQEILGTYIIIKTAAELYKLEQVFVDVDYGTAVETKKFRNRRYSKSDFLLSNYLKNPKLKMEYILNSTSPKYYFNAVFPLGMDKLISLNPVTVYRNLKQKLNGKYYEYVLDEKDRVYNRKGCIFEFEPIKNGTFVSGVETPINVNAISDDYKNTLLKIMEFCKKRGIRLNFCAYPVSDFLLKSKGNYDEFHYIMKNFLNKYGYEFYDFNLTSEKYLSFEDKDFNDDNHLNDRGIKKFTQAVSDFIMGSFSNEDFFYSSYQEKLNNQTPRILGVMLEENDSKTSINYFPVLNNGDKEKISWRICVESDGVETIFIENTKNTSLVFPQDITGDLKIYGYYDGVEQTCTKKFFNTK